MDDLIRQALLLLRGTWQWRWLGVAVAWLVGIVAAVMIARMPDQYEASARIYVDTQSVLKPLMSGLAVQPDLNFQIQILSRTLISRPNMEKLSRLADLDHNVNTKQEQDGLTDHLMRSVVLRSASGDNIYVVAYRDTQPQRAQRVVQALTSMFVESSLGDKRKDTDFARQFIEDQIKIYEQKLIDAENRLKKFKLRNLGLNMSDGKGGFSRMAEVSNALSQARLDLREAENSRDALKRQISGEEPVLLGGVLQESTTPTFRIPELDNRIDALKGNLDGLLQRYTDQHPDVVGARRVIRDLEDQRRQELAARSKAAASVAKSPSSANTNIANNPVYQQLKVSLAEAEANVASLQTRVAEYEARFNRSKGSIEMVPEIEAEYTQLNRDYAIHKSNYESLVSRRESAEMSGQMEATSAMVDFRLIDPPRVYPRPVAPDRVRLFTLALLGALAAGLFASFAASQLRPSFVDARSLRDVTGLPLLGTVTLIVTEAMKRKERRGLVGFIACVVALLGSYGAGIAFLSVLAGRG